MNRAKLEQIAAIADTLTERDMDRHQTCAMGRAVKAGILKPLSATGFSLNNSTTSSRYAAEQLGITQNESFNIFIMSTHGEDCARKIRNLLRRTVMG